MFERLKTRAARHTAACSEITALVSRSLEEPLSLSDRLRVWFHLQLCEFCARFRTQMQLIRGLAAQTGGLSRSARNRIETAVREKISSEERD